MGKFKKQYFFEYGIPVIFVLFFAIFGIYNQYITTRNIKEQTKSTQFEVNNIKEAVGITADLTIPGVIKTITFGDEVLPYESEIPEISDYPKIKINNTVEWAKLFITIDLDKAYISGYYNYVYGYNTKGDKVYAPYGFNIFLGDLNYGGYVNVCRNANGGVLNINELGLFGAVEGSEIVGGYTYEIPLKEVNVSVKDYEYRPDFCYKKLKFLDKINNNVGKILPIGGYLSSEGKKGWEFTIIKKISIQYIGPDNAIEFVK